MQIGLASGNDREEQARAQLLRLLDQYDLRKWQFTESVQIDATAIPHSWPVLTLNTRYLDNDHRALATYVHEQLHWFAPGWRPSVYRAMAELRERFPEVPPSELGGARDENSTYLHLIVCPLEYASLIELLGPDPAQSVVETRDFYRWIYATVLREGAYFQDFLNRHGLSLADVADRSAARSQSSNLASTTADRGAGIPALLRGVDGPRPETSTQTASLGAQLYVLDPYTSADFYVQALGFTVQYTRPFGMPLAKAPKAGNRTRAVLDYVSLRNGAVLLGLAPWAADVPNHDYLHRGPAAHRGLGLELLLMVDDAREAERRVVEAGFSVESPCQRRPWGAIDFRLIDPDGYYIRVSSRS